MRMNRIKNILFLFVSIALVIILISQIKIDDIKRAVSNFRPIFILYAFSLHLLLQFVRARRLRLLISSRRIRIWDLFKVTVVHNMMNKILPARTGEFSYFLLLKREKIGIGESIATFIAARVFEIFVLLLSFLISLIVLRDKIPFLSTQLFYIFSFTLLFLIICLTLIFLLPARFLNIAKKIFRGREPYENKFVISLFARFKEVIESIKVIHFKRNGMPITVYSFLIFFLIYLIFYFLFQGLNINLKPAELVFIVTIPLVIQALPIHSIGGFGTTEGGYTAAFIMLGMSKELGIISGFCLNIITNIFSLLLGLWGIYLLKR